MSQRGELDRYIEERLLADFNKEFAALRERWIGLERTGEFNGLIGLVADDDE